MYISKQYLNEQRQSNILNESSVYFSNRRPPRDGKYDIFFSYSLHDLEYAKLIVQLLERSGFSVYIDINDSSIDRSNVNVKTALILAKRMGQCRSLLYLYSKASSVSKWCPWELGYVSGITNFRCAKIPLVQVTSDKIYEKQEYLDIYPTIDYDTFRGSNQMRFWVNDSESKYVELKEWINGKDPESH